MRPPSEFGVVPNSSAAHDARRPIQCHRAPVEERLLYEPYSLLATRLKVLLRLVPTKLNAAIAATAINAAINAYSIAVTPESSLTRLMRVRNRILLCFGKTIARRVRHNL